MKNKTEYLRAITGPRLLKNNEELPRYSTLELATKAVEAYRARAEGDTHRIGFRISYRAG